MTGVAVERPRLLDSNPSSQESFLLQNAKTSVRPKIFLYSIRKGFSLAKLKAVGGE